LGKGIAWVAAVGGGIVLAGCLYLMSQDQPRPSGDEGQDAEDLAAEMEDAVDIVGWARTGAVRWTFNGANEHLWDRQRGLVRVRWDDVEVLLHEGGQSGRAYRNGAEVTGREGFELRVRGNAAWVNDSFWLNPVAKIHDSGVTRSIVGDDQLLVEYSSGGLTPGDAYLWSVDDDGLPTHWQLWVSILPIGGVEVSWDDWVRLETGARISTSHTGPAGVSFSITDVEGAATLRDLIGSTDPFAPILGD